MEDYSQYKIRELRSLCKQFGIDVKSTRKADFIEALEAHYAGIETDSPVVSDKTILFFPSAIYNPALGKYEKGYHLFSNEEAEKWLSVARRVRVADPKEVAEYYGV